jgi:hypothetical protein
MGARFVTAPVRDPRPARGDLDVWSPQVELGPELIAAYAARARRLRIEAVGKFFAGIAAALGRFLRRS